MADLFHWEGDCRGLGEMTQHSMGKEAGIHLPLWFSLGQFSYGVWVGPQVRAEGSQVWEVEVRALS